jgi:PAS domain S-box-containing protein
VLTRYTKLIPAGSAYAYAVAGLAVGVAILLRILLRPLLGDQAPFVTLYPAVLIAAILGGGAPGLLALVLGGVAAFLQYDLPSASPKVTIAEVSSLVLYLAGGGLSVLAAASLRNARARLETAQEKLLAALDASRTGTWHWDVKRNRVEWDPAMRQVFDLGAASPPNDSESFFALIHPEDRERVVATIRNAVKRGAQADHEFRVVLPDGSVRWIYDRSRVIPDADGSAMLMVGACLDVTERKRTEERQKFLMNELHHRVKNTLATVHSLAAQTLRNSASPEEFEESFVARLMALSTTHNLLTDSEWESASLHDILAAELEPHGGIDAGRVTIRGEAVRLKPQQALSLGMAFHELLTNAVKYGALSSPKGRVAITWRTEAAESSARTLVIGWREEDGPTVGPPQRKGFGSKLMERSIRDELMGSLEMAFDPDGLLCTFRLPL